MKYLKLFEEAIYEEDIKEYFHSVTDAQGVMFKCNCYENTRIENQKVDATVYLNYENLSNFNPDNLEESIDRLKGDGYKILNDSLYFEFFEIHPGLDDGGDDEIPNNIIKFKSVPDKHTVEKTYNNLVSKYSTWKNCAIFGNWEDSIDEYGKLKIEITIFK